MRLNRSFSALETWGFGFTGLLLWLLTFSAVGGGSGSQALLVWIPVAFAGMVVNFQVRHLGAQWPDLIGGTAIYTARLYQDQPAVGRYAALAYLQGWASVPPLGAIAISQLINVILKQPGSRLSDRVVIVAFTLIAFVIALAGTRALSILHLFFIIPAIGLLLLFSIQGVLWRLWAPESAGITLPQAIDIDFRSWATWYFVAVYAACGVESAAAFIGESRRPSVSLRCLTVAAWLIPVVYIGGSLVIGDLADGKNQNIVEAVAAAASPFWGSFTPFLVTFMIACGYLLTCATAVALGPRIVYQLGRDRSIAPMFGAVSEPDVPMVAIAFFAGNALLYLLFDPVTALLVSGTGYFVSIAMLHLGIWRRRGKPESRWPYVALGLFVVEVIVFIWAVPSLGWLRVSVGLAVPAVVAFIGRSANRFQTLATGLESRLDKRRDRRRVAWRINEGVQVALLILIVCVAATIGWVSRAAVSQVSEVTGHSFFAVMLISVAFFGVAGAAWTTLRQLHHVAAQAKEFSRSIELILNSAGEGIFGLDMDGAVTFVNPAGAGILGYEVDDLLGRRMHDIAHHTRADGTPNLWEDCPAFMALKLGTFQSSDLEMFWRQDGSHFPVDFIANPMYDEPGKVIGAVVTFRDISERYEIDRMKSEFVSTVSHELRTPLTSIRGSLGLLGSGLLGQVGEKGEKMLSIAISNTDRLIRLINDILDIERLESGNVSLQLTRLSAADLLRESVENMRAFAAGSGVALEFEGGDVDVLGDHDRLIQTLTNLLSNAVKFSPEGSRVVASAERHGRLARFAVHDRGRGIPPDKLDLIFERFQQVDASDAREKGGTGLGLPISRSIVLEHGGTIWAESTPGRTTFYFTIPVADVDTTSTPPNVAAAAAPVLICDDDPSMRAVLKELLEARGYAVVTADRGDVAVDLARELRPCAIILDLVMDGVSGWQALALLREDEQTREIPIIVASVLSPREAGQTHPLDQAALAGWLQKPFDERLLFEQLERIVGDASSPLKILLVEDDADLARVLIAGFARHGVTTYHATTGTEAIELASSIHPSLLILDVGLPQMSGYEVVKWLRRDQRLANVPVVVYSGADITEEERAQLKLGPTEFLMKTRIAPEEFEKRVMDLLDAVTNKRTS